MTVCRYCKCAVLAGQATYGMSGNHFDCHESALADLKVLEEINIVIKHYMDCRGMSREAATVAVMRERRRAK